MEDQLKEANLVNALNFVLKNIIPWEDGNIPEYITTKEIIERIEPHYPGYNIDALIIIDLLQKGLFFEGVDPIDGGMKWKVVEFLN